MSNLDHLNGLLTLVLNADFTPMQTIDWRPAVEDVLSGKSRVLEEHPRAFARSERLAIAIPSVIAIQVQRHLYKQAPLTRENIIDAYWQPDVTRKGLHWTCALCGERMSLREITLEHIVPKFKNGQDTWENIVPAHGRCNNLKGHKTLGQAKMSLKIPILRPTDAMLAENRIRRQIGDQEKMPENWLPYLNQISA